MLEGEGGGVGGKEGRKEGGSSMLAHRLLCGCANCKGSQPSGFESGPVIAKGGGDVQYLGIADRSVLHSSMYLHVSK